MNYLGDVMESFAGEVLSSLGLQRRTSTAELLVPAIGGLAVGVLVGGAAALLLAPTSGAELRARLSDQLADARDKARDAADQVRERVKRTTNTANTPEIVRGTTRSDA
jgi:hypothetical protein